MWRRCTYIKTELVYWIYKKQNLLFIRWTVGGQESFSQVPLNLTLIPRNSANKYTTSQRNQTWRQSDSQTRKHPKCLMKMMMNNVFLVIQELCFFFKGSMSSWSLNCFNRRGPLWLSLKWIWQWAGKNRTSCSWVQTTASVTAVGINLNAQRPEGSARGWTGKSCLCECLRRHWRGSMWSSNQSRWHGQARVHRRDDLFEQTHCQYRHLLSGRRSCSRVLHTCIPAAPTAAHY